MTPNRFAQAGLSAHGDGLYEILDFENRFLGVPYQPKYDRVDIYGDGIAGECGFRGDAGHANSLIDVAAESIDDGNHVENARPPEPDIPAQPQYRDFLPLIGHLDRKQEIETNQKSADGRLSTAA